MSNAGKRRGRPAKTSREKIVDKAVELVLAVPGEPLSFHRLARALGITPMAIYGHIADKDALLQAVAARILEGLRPEIPADATWETQLRALATATRRHFLKYPGLFAVLGWQAHIASAWLGQISVLARLLSDAGFRGPALATAVQWTSNTLVASIFMETAARQSGFQVSPEDIAQLPEADAARVAAIMRYLLPRSAASVFDDSVDHVIIALQARLQCPAEALAPADGKSAADSTIPGKEHGKRQKSLK
ncbi:MAG: hypothetical protein RBS22_06710 [Spongiibacteraceae bacterium]|nr:hypothetical protein [Spongiibacteraceae bacterium]